MKKEEIEFLDETLVNQIGEIGFRNGVIIGVTRWIQQQKALEENNLTQHKMEKTALEILFAETNGNADYISVNNCLKAMKAYAQQQTEIAVEKALPKWIDVNDRLPENDIKKQYLVNIRDACYGKQWFTVAKYFNDKWSVKDLDQLTFITHYQLPSPPQQIIEQLNK